MAGLDIQVVELSFMSLALFWFCISFIIESVAQIYAISNEMCNFLTHRMGDLCELFWIICQSVILASFKLPNKCATQPFRAYVELLNLSRIYRFVCVCVWCGWHCASKWNAPNVHFMHFDAFLRYIITASTSTVSDQTLVKWQSFDNFTIFVTLCTIRTTTFASAFIC